MPERIPHETAAEEPERIVVDLDARGDAIWIEGVVFSATMLDCDPLDETSNIRIGDRRVGIIIGQEHQRLPARSLARGRRIAGLEQRLGKDERERMIG